MLKRRSLFCAALVGAALALAPSAHAGAPVPITSLFSTGIGANGLPVAEGSADTHYSLIASPTGSGYGATTYVTSSAPGYPIGPWMANSSTSQWIEPVSGTSSTHLVGLYDYQTTFDLTGFNPQTASITLRVAVDNNLTDILVNNHSTGFAYSGFTSFSNSVTINTASFFQAGVNTLTFRTSNDSNGTTANLQNPTGLRVEIQGASAAKNSPVPEPASILMLAGALAPAALVARRRNK